MRTRIVLLSLAAVCLTVNSPVLATNQLVPIIAADANVTNLVSWWKFNEGSGVTAYDSAGTNDGTIHGATWTTDYTGIALDFDGDDYVEVSDDPSLRFNQYDSFSICSWAKPVGGFIVCKMRASEQMGYFGYNTGYTTGNKYFFTTEKSMYGSVSIYTGEIHQGEWSHVTAVYDNKDMKIYLNGELEDTGIFTYDTGSTAPDKDLAIGARSVDSFIDRHFNGIIDDVRIYNRALSVEEIHNIIESSCPNCPPVIWISATEFIFLAVEGEPNPESQILRIERMGMGTLNWEVTADCNCVSAEPNNGKCTSEVDDVNIVVDISGLGVGLHECELSVSDPNAVNSPQTAKVTLHVLDDYELHVPSVFETIQEAIDIAFNGASIIVAPGTYTGSGNRDIDFKGKEITVRSINPSDPNVVAATVINCQGSESEPHRGFYFHSGEDGNSVLDGFTIRNGYAESRNDGGGGICCIGGSPIISNCIITNNKTGLYRDDYPAYAGHGGGVFLEDSKARILSCIISNNRTHDGAFSMPGTDGGYGGGIYCEDSSPRIINCLISNNITGHGGDGDFMCDPYMCVFSDGGDGGDGGGIYLTGSAGYYAIIAHCTITGNTTGLGGFVYSSDATPGEQGQGGGIYVSGHQPDIIDSIFWSNSLVQIHGNASVTYCDVQGGYTGIGNINLDPRFVSGPEGDYYLSQTAAGQAIDSPCVDRGSNTAINLGMNMFTTRTDESLDKGIVDMGYHYAIGPGSGDIDENLHVDCFDYSILAADWRNCSSVNYLPGDITRDTCVNGKDLKVLAECWLNCYVTEATNPNPTHYSIDVNPDSTLRWVPHGGALDHDVYLGTEANAVTNAGHGSPEFMGTVSEPNFDPCGLELETTYYWRIDEVGPSCTTQGEVWSFTTYGEPDFHLVGWWKFDEGGGTIAYDSAGTNNGTINGAAWTSGQIGGALDFDGVDDYVLVSDSDSISVGNQDYTICAWIYQKSILPEPTLLGVVSKVKDGTDKEYFLSVYDGELRLDVERNSNNQFAQTTTSPVTVNSWQFIVVTFDSSITTPTFYHNAEFQPSDNIIDTLPDSLSDNLYIGLLGGVYMSYPFDGTIDDVRIYDRALTAGEILELYQDGLN